MAILWNKCTDHLANDIEFGNERIKCIELNTKQKLLIVCVYMPCNGEKDSYHAFADCIDQLNELILRFQITHDIIIGDFNEKAIVNNGSKRSQTFHTFLKENELETKKKPGFTFVHPNGRDTSAIDFYIQTEMFSKSCQNDQK